MTTDEWGSRPNVAAIGDLTVSVLSLVCAGVAFGFNTPTLYSIGQTLAGPRVAAKWMGVQNCVGNLAGIIAPIVTGLVVDWTGHYDWAFVIAAAIAALGIVGWGFMIRKVESLDWEPENPGADERQLMRGLT